MYVYIKYFDLYCLFKS